MDAAADAGQAVKPLGFVGLCLSLPAIGILGVLLAVLIGVAAGLVAAVAMGWHAMLETARQSLQTLARPDSAEGMRALFALILVFHISLAIAVVLAAQWRGKRQWRALIGWRPFRLSDKVIWAIMAAALLYSAAASGALSHFMPHSAARLTLPTDPIALLQLFALAVIIAPLTEEFVFRGWIYTALRFHWGLWPALLVTSALFAFAHYEDTHLYALAVFPIGLALGAIRERAGSVKASVLFHALNNFTAFCLVALYGS